MEVCIQGTVLCSVFGNVVYEMFAQSEVLSVIFSTEQ
jgi:hypothetical protein